MKQEDLASTYRSRDPARVSTNKTKSSSTPWFNKNPKKHSCKIFAKL